MNGQAEATNTLRKSNDSFTVTETMPEELNTDHLESSEATETEADLTLNESCIMDEQAHADQAKSEATDKQSVEQPQGTAKTGPPVARVAPMPRAQNNQTLNETNAVQPVRNRSSRNSRSPIFEVQIEPINMPMPSRVRIIMQPQVHYARSTNLVPNRRQNSETRGQRMRRYGRILGSILSQLIECLTWVGPVLAVFMLLYAIIIIIKRPRA